MAAGFVLGVLFTFAASTAVVVALAVKAPHWDESQDYESH